MAQKVVHKKPGVQMSVQNSSKMSEIHTLTIPAGWRWVGLGEVCSVHPGQHILESDYNRERVGVGYLTGPADFRETPPSVTKWTERPKAWCEPGDVLVTVKGAGVGKSNLAPNERVAIGRQLMAIHPKPELIEQIFLYYVVIKQFSKLQAKALGSTVPGLGRENIESLEIPLPPLVEQQRIATKIQELMQDVEHARTACEKQLEAANALPAAYLRQVFESEDAKKWERKRLGEICEFEYGKGLPERDRLGGNVPVYGSNGVVGYHNISITNGSTIITGRKGSIGQVNYSEIACWPIDTTYYIDPSKTSCDLHYLYWLLKWLGLDILNKATGVPGLNRNDAYDQFVPLPSLPVQQRIATELEEKMAEVKKLRTSIEKELEAINSLPQVILRKAFRGEL